MWFVKAHVNSHQNVHLHLLENHQASETSVCTHQRGMMVEDLPEQPKSDYRSERKYHPPKMQVEKSPKWNQSDNGPLLTALSLFHKTRKWVHN